MKDDELGRVYSDGEVIFDEGAVGETMYVIQSGKVNIDRKTASGGVTIATLGSGEVFGEMALFDRMPRSATAVASGEARVLSIDKKKLFSTINRDPTLVFKILESMSKRIRALDEELTKFKEKNAEVGRLTIDVEETCRLVLEEAKNIIKAENGSIMLLENDGKSLAIKTAFGPESDPKLKLTVGEGIAGDVMRTGRAELVNNVSMDSRFVRGGANIRSLLCVPLRMKDGSFGVINMSNCSEVLFTIDDLKLLHSLAIYASVAIQSAMNFSSLKSATDEMLRHATMLDM